MLNKQFQSTLGGQKPPARNQGTLVLTMPDIVIKEAGVEKLLKGQPLQGCRSKCDPCMLGSLVNKIGINPDPILPADTE